MGDSVGFWRDRRVLITGLRSLDGRTAELEVH